MSGQDKPRVTIASSAAAAAKNKSSSRQRGDASRILNANIEKINNAKGGDKGILDRIGDSAKASVNTIGKVLEPLNIPRQVLQSGMKEFMDAAGGDDKSLFGTVARTATRSVNPALSFALQGSNAINDATGLDKTPGNERFSYADLARQARRGSGFGAGNIIEDYQGNLPMPLKIAGGFVGDVVTDPLTYVSGGAGITASGGKRGLMRAAVDAGSDDIAAKIGQRGISSLSKEELAKLSELTGRTIDPGISLRTPGTGRVAQRLSKTKAAGKLGFSPIEETSTVIARSGPRKVNQALVSGRNSITSSEAFKVAEKALGGDARMVEARRLMRSGDGEAARIGLRTSDAMNRGALASRKFASDAKIVTEKALRDFKALSGGTDEAWETLARALQGEEGAMAKVASLGSKAGRKGEVITGDGVLAKFRELLDKTPDNALEAARFEGIGDKFIESTDNYFPRILTDDAMDAIGERARTGTMGGAHSPAFFEKARMKAGDKFLGQTLEDPALVGKTIEQQVDEIGKARLGDQYADLFSRDPRKVLPAYFTAVTKRVEEKYIENYLRFYGEVVENVSRLRGAQQADALVASIAQEIKTAEQGLAVAKGRLAAAKAAAAPEEEIRRLTALANAAENEIANLTARAEEAGGVAEMARAAADTVAVRYMEIEDQIDTLNARLRKARGAEAKDLNRQIKKLMRHPDRIRAIELNIAGAHAGGVDASQWVDTLRQAQPNHPYFVSPILGEPAAMAEVEQRWASTLNELAARAQASLGEGATMADEAAATALQLEAMQRAEELTSAIAGLPGGRQAAALIKQAELYEAQNVSLRVSKQLAEQAAARVNRPFASAQQIEDAVAAGWKQFGYDLQAPEHVIDVLVNAGQKMGGPSGFGREFLRYYDRVHNWTKAWLIATPGFNWRNMMGATFNNWLAGVDAGSTSRFMNIYGRWLNNGRNIDALTGKFSPREIEAFRQIVDNGLINSGQVLHEIDRAIDVSRFGSKNPFNSNFAYLKGMRNFGNEVENVARGSLAYDRLLKDLPIETAIDDVYKYHFNYDDLSAAERGVIKRVIPFYTWTRKNLPLQIEQMVLQPEKFLRYEKLKANVEKQSDPESIVPSYFGKMYAMRLPFNTSSIAGGLGADGQAYYTPDLPYRDLQAFLSPFEMAQNSMTPLIKTPMELAAGKRFFNDAPFRDSYETKLQDGSVVGNEPPKTWTWIPGFMPALQQIGWAEKREGQWVMKDRHIYAVGQYLPMLSQAQRLAPSDERGQQRLVTTWASWLLGTNLRANTYQDQQNEIFRQNREAESWLRRYEELNPNEEL